MKRYFTHVTRFGDATAYVVYEPSCGVFVVDKFGSKTPLLNHFELPQKTVNGCVQFVKSGHWKEITEPEAMSLVDFWWILDI